MFRPSSACIAALLVTACASAPTYSDADKAAIQPLQEEHEACLGGETAKVIDGSDDVAFLVQHVTSTCDPLLEPIADYLRGRGFSQPYVASYLRAVRQRGAQITASFILRQKSGQGGY